MYILTPNISEADSGRISPYVSVDTAFFISVELTEIEIHIISCIRRLRMRRAQQSSGFLSRHHQRRLDGRSRQRRRRWSTTGGHGRAEPATFGRTARRDRRQESVKVERRRCGAVPGQPDGRQVSCVSLERKVNEV